MSAGILFDIVLHVFKIYTLPNVGPTVLLADIFGLWYSMARYKFPLFQLSMAPNKIISNIQELVYTIT
jgi:hypothetical protein